MKFLTVKVAPIFLIALFLLISSCNNDDTPSFEETQWLVSSEFVYANSADQLRFLVQLSGIDVDPNEFLYDVEIYKVVYNTMYDGSPIQASGLVAVPVTTQEVGMLSYHHGTITNHEDAPTNLSSSDFNTISYAAMASAGFIGVIPDYLGFGSSSSIVHPYYVETLTASSILDMLRASGELASQKNLAFNGKLFLAGYSEGGYATMAAHKAIEEDGLEDFTLVASFPGAGAYDLKGMQEYIFDQSEYGDPHYLAYIAHAYQLHYNDDRFVTDFFNEPYASRIPGLFDGEKGAGDINDELTSNLSTLIQQDVLDNIDTNPDYDYLVSAFNENSLTDWNPQIKMFLYHGLSDTTVPYENSVRTFDQLIANGASTSVVTLTPLEGTHSSAIQAYIGALIPTLLALK